MTAEECRNSGLRPGGANEPFHQKTALFEIAAQLAKLNEAYRIVNNLPPDQDP